MRRTTSRDSDVTQQYLDDGGDAEEQQLEQDRNLLYQQLQDEEDELITAHRKQIEATMAIVREEMNLLAQVWQWLCKRRFHLDACELLCSSASTPACILVIWAGIELCKCRHCHAANNIATICITTLKCR